MAHPNIQVKTHETSQRICQLVKHTEPSWHPAIFVFKGGKLSESRSSLPRTAGWSLNGVRRLTCDGGWRCWVLFSWWVTWLVHTITAHWFWNKNDPCLQFLLAELNTFYLKFVLWMPPEHYLVLLRLVFFVNVGGVAMREIYDFMDDPYVQSRAFSIQMSCFTNCRLLSSKVTSQLQLLKLAWNKSCDSLFFSTVMYIQVKLKNVVCVHSAQW